MSENILIEASAGTGKTHTLAQHLIALLETGVRPQEIVALTFSRAAAGEIFERFVTMLRAQGKARLLREVLATQHLSQIGTLDSFLMRIVRAFPHELGLPADLEMMDDYQSARDRSRVSFGVLRRTEAEKKAAFVEAFMLAMNHENVRSFVASYRDFVKVWHERVMALPDPSAWGDPRTIWGADPKFAHVSERELAAAADAVEKTFPDDAKWRAFAAWVRAFRGKFNAKSGYEKKLLDAGDVFQGDVYSFQFSRKTIVLTRDQTLVVRDALLCVYGYVVRQKLELARGIYRLVSSFEAEYDKLVRTRGHLVFSDVPRLLAGLPDETRLSLEYRMDCSLRAWALDEFQDTSRDQWRAIANLIDEAKQSDEKSVFIVGDRKQAIYGWRNGDVSIFKSERQSGLYRDCSLTKTYRAGPQVVEAVNCIFTKGRICAEFPDWECPEHTSARPDRTGFVRVEDAFGAKKEDFVEPVYRALLDRPRGSTAVLVRSNALGELLAERLKAMGMKDVEWEGESAVLGTPALSGFLDLVQLADHPGDLLTYRHFCLTPLAKAKWPKGVPPISELSREMAESLTTRGLVRTLRELRACLPENPDEAWSAYTEENFTEMLRAAAHFELGVGPSTRMADFPTFLASQKKRLVAEEDKVKIMTIHHSKGLGFNYVVLPLYEQESLTAEDKGPLVGENWILPDPSARVAKAVGELERAYRLRKDRAEQEELCAYYVALTRAMRAMTIICHPAPKSATAGVRFSDLVRSAWKDFGASWDAAPQAADEAPPQAPAETPEPSAPQPDAAPVVRQPRAVVRRRLPSLQFHTGMSAGLLFASNEARREARRRGTAAHRAMEDVLWSETLPKPEGFVELWRERAFEVWADGEWISGRFDRVTFFDRGAGLEAEIVDFKSSLRNPERYDGQLAAYRRAVHALTGIPEARIQARLVQI